MMLKGVFMLVMLAVMANCNNQATHNQSETMAQDADTTFNKDGLDSATFGAGCFWCVEAVFDQFKGVEKVESGYAGGKTLNPTYQQVCSGETGHAEVARIFFDPKVISYEDLLEVFFHSHDPTTLNRQGADVGTQYRSVVFYHNEGQKEAAQKKIKEIDERGLWDSKIVTKVDPITNYSKAEDYHQNYYNSNPNKPYCSAVIAPKLRKIREKFADKLK